MSNISDLISRWRILFNYSVFVLLIITLIVNGNCVKRVL